MLRALVLIQSARGRDWMAVSLLVPAGAYLWIAEVSSHSVETLATEFMVFAGLLLLYFAIISLLIDWCRAAQWRNSSAATSASANSAETPCQNRTGLRS